MDQQKQTKAKKESVTDAKYQSTFLPIFQDAETRIKSYILLAFFIGINISVARMVVAGMIQEVGKKIPAELHDRDAYLNGLTRKSGIMFQKFYKKPTEAFIKAKESFIAAAPEGKHIVISSPKELNQAINKAKGPMWAEAKGSPNVQWYEKEVKKAVEGLANEPITTAEPGKKPISIWQKAELDVRYDHQLKMIEDLKNEGVQYAYISSHPDCSKRCECWQGELVALNIRAKAPQKTVDKKWHYKKSSFIVDKIEGHNVYSLPDIKDVVGPYGYANNVITGFNCRHRLIPYQPGKNPPTEYDEKDVAKQRKIEEKIRAMERNIRLHKTRAKLYNEIGEFKLAKQIEAQVKVLVDRYKKFCEANGYAWYEYRIKI